MGVIPKQARTTRTPKGKTTNPTNRKEALGGYVEMTKVIQCNHCYKEWSADFPNQFLVDHYKQHMDDDIIRHNFIIKEKSNK